MPSYPFRGRAGGQARGRGGSRGRGQGRPGPSGTRQTQHQQNNNSLTSLLTTLVSAVATAIGPSLGGNGGRGAGSQHRPPSTASYQQDPPHEGNRNRNQTRPPVRYQPYDNRPRNQRDYNQGEYQPRDNNRGSQFQSENPDFVQLVRSTNQGARIQNAMSNWERLPPTVDRAIDRIQHSIRPPMPDEGLHNKIKSAAGQFKNAIRHIVNEHLVAKYTQTTRTLASLDQRDREQAKQVARKQLLRSNGRMQPQRADDLISITTVDGDGWRYIPQRRRSNGTTTPPRAQAPASAPVPTQNRFGALANEADDDLITLETCEAILSEPFESSGSPQAAMQRGRTSTSPPRKMAKSKQVQVTVDVEPLRNDFRAPHNVGPPPASPHPGTSGQNMGTDDRRPTISLPCPPTPQASPQTVAAAPRMRLAVFNPGDRQSWTLPMCRDDEDTVMIADSNGRTLALHTPPNWRIASYRGARLEDVAQLLSRHPLPDSIKTIIITVGVNNKDNNDAAMCNNTTRLRDVLQVQTRAVRILEVPYFVDEPIQQLSNAVTINRYFADLFTDAGWLITLPEGFEVHRRAHFDVHHYSTESAAELVSHLTRSLDLNSPAHPQ